MQQGWRGQTWGWIYFYQRGKGSYGGYILNYSVHLGKNIFSLRKKLKIFFLDVYSGAPSLEDIEENNKNVRIHVQQLMHALGTFCKNNINYTFELMKITK